MATYNGRNGRVTVNGDTTEKIVLELGSWSLDITADEVDTTSFGNGWKKSDVGMKGWSGSASGSYDPLDTTGQKVLLDAFDSGALLNDVRFYIAYSTTVTDTNLFFVPDITTDTTAGLRVTGTSVSLDKSGVATVSFSFSGSGPLLRDSEVVSG